jgi:hypothetical protein
MINHQPKVEQFLNPAGEQILHSALLSNHLVNIKARRSNESPFRYNEHSPWPDGGDCLGQHKRNELTRIRKEPGANPIRGQTS